jgi:hypothetical protein
MIVTLRQGIVAGSSNATNRRPGAISGLAASDRGTYTQFQHLPELKVTL